jgi:hypothetical protein
VFQRIFCIFEQLLQPIQSITTYPNDTHTQALYRTQSSRIMDWPKTLHATDATPHLFDVFLRLRPSPNSSDAFLQYKPGQPIVSCTPTGTDPSRKRSRGIEKFSFTQVFDENCKQRDVFTDVALPLLAEVVKGRDGMLATLGVTGSGKTHTILGSHSERGMTQLALDVLFRSISDRLVDVSARGSVPLIG